jgi:glucose/arabinose dehydrogenase
MRELIVSMLLLMIISVPACARDDRQAEGVFKLVPVAGDLKKPTAITHASDGSGRLFVLEQKGRIIALSGQGHQERRVVLDITGRVGCCGERGLLGLAFSPEGGHFFVNYTDKGRDTVVSRFDMKDGSSKAGTEKIIIKIAQPYSNHNGGQIAFGPDGYLYVGVGDGGSGGDPYGNGQDPGTLLGTILRLDVSDKKGGYSSPPDNPFVGMKGRRPEIWALGLRNPWRFSFDRETGDLYIADVGQDRYEEINYENVTSKGGLNYGWNTMEGAHCFKPRDCSREGMVLPVAEYTHSDGCSVTGGMVYRGEKNKGLYGIYLYADYCSGKLWGLRQEGGKWSTELLMETGLMISTFGEDEAGELYLADYKGGNIYRIEPR